MDKTYHKFDCIEVIGGYIQLNKNGGNNFSCNCPFHSERTDSLIVSPDKNLWKCFGCGEGGDATAFVAKYNNISYGEAYKILCEQHGIEVVNSIPEDVKRMYEINANALNWFQHVFRNSASSKLASEYLEARKISSDTIKTFGVGYTLTNDKVKTYNEVLTETINAKNYELVDVGLMNSKGNLLFNNRITIPIFSPNQKVLGFVGRSVDDNDKLKYVNTSDTKIFKKGNVLFNLQNAIKEKSDVVYVVEGPFDVMSMHEAGIKNTVCTLGCQITNSQINLLKKHFKKVVVCYDSDKAGIRASIRAYKMLRDEKVDSSFVFLIGKDPNEILISASKDVLKDEILNNTFGFYKYFISVYQNVKDTKADDGSIKYQQKLFELLEYENSNVRDAVLNVWAKVNNQNPDELKKDFVSKLSSDEKVKLSFYELVKWYLKSKKCYLKHLEVFPKNLLSQVQKDFLNHLYSYYAKYDRFEIETFVQMFPGDEKIARFLDGYKLSLTPNEALLSFVNSSMLNILKGKEE